MAHRLQITLSALSFLYAGASGASAQSVALAAKTAAGTATAGPALRTADGHPDLQGYFTTATVTPLERPKDLGNKAFFTPEEAAAYAKKQLAHTGTNRQGNLRRRALQHGPVRLGEEPKQGRGQRSYLADFRPARRPDSCHDAGSSRAKCRTRRQEQGPRVRRPRKSQPGRALHSCGRMKGRP